MPASKTSFHTKSPVSFTQVKSKRDADHKKTWLTIAVALIASMVILGYSYFDLLSATTGIWSKAESYQFCFLIIPIALYLIWNRHQQLLPLRPEPLVWPLFITPLFCVLFLLADAIHLLIGTQFAFIAMIQLLLFGTLGRRIYLALLFPLCFLWLLIPFGDTMVPGLMSLTTHTTSIGLNLAGLNATTDGNIVISEAGRIGIIEACSSMSFVIGNLVISLIFANLAYSYNGKRLLYVLAAIPVAVAANNLRIISLILITHWSDQKWDLISDHQSYSWFLFLCCALIQIGVGARYMDPLKYPHPNSRISSNTNLKKKPLDLFLQRLVMATLICAAPGIYSSSSSHSTLTPISESVSPPKDSLCTPDWLTERHIDSGATPDNRWKALYPGAQLEIYQQYISKTQSVDFYIAYYPQQHKQAELIGWPNATYDRKNWHYMGREKIDTNIDGKNQAINQTRVRGPDRARRLTWHWYWVDGQFTASDWMAKALSAKALVFGGDKRSAAIVLSADEGGNAAKAQQAMADLLQKENFIASMLDHKNNCK